MTQRPRIAERLKTIFVDNPTFALVGAPVAAVVAFLHGVPPHARVMFLVMVLVTGLGITLGFHRLFAHRAFATVRPVEQALMVLGCMAGQNSPFYWVATHRAHHRHSDHEGDPHSPYVWGTRRFGFLRGFWHSYFGWLHANGYSYPASAIRDLTRRSDLAWIDRHWFHFYLIGLGIPALAGLAIGGTAYDALMGLLWGGLFRHFALLQVTFAVNSICHLWGSRPYDTDDHSRNNFLLGVIAFGDGWHNNHHAFPHSARHGLHWWQPDFTYSVIWLMERVGLAWRVKRPDPVRSGGTRLEQTAA
jgi:stearoyl-CoA desaturase (Delta-9 desaturase)